MPKLTNRQRATLALEGKQADYVPTFELDFQLTEEAFGKKFYQGAEYNNLPKSDRIELCRKNAELYLEIAERYEYSIIKIDHAPSSIFPQRSQELVATMRFIRAMTHEKNEDYLLITHGDATLAIPEGDSLYEIIEYLSDAPEKLKAMAEMNIYPRLGHCLYYAEAGFDGFALCSDYAFNANPFFSPSQFAEFVQPYLKRIISTYRNMGKYVIKHTDGNIMPIIDMIIECAPHAIHSIDPQGEMDIAEVKKLYGSQVALCGNVNCGLIETGTEDEVLASCEYAMKHGKPNGGYIFSSSNTAYKGMPLERYELVNNYWKKHRYY
jgi:uroporphyrinogen decarboxylase